MPILPYQIGTVECNSRWTYCRHRRKSREKYSASGLRTRVSLPHTKRNVLNRSLRHSHHGHRDDRFGYVLPDHHGQCEPYRKWTMGSIFRLILGSSRSSRRRLCPLDDHDGPRVDCLCAEGSVTYASLSSPGDNRALISLEVVMFKSGNCRIPI